MGAWAHRVGVNLDFIRPWRPVQNGYIESFNGRLRDECLNTEVFLNIADAHEKDRTWAPRLQPAAAAQFAGGSNAGGIRSDAGRPALRPSHCG
jgi:transposase InsO family protein